MFGCLINIVLIVLFLVIVLFIFGSELLCNFLFVLFVGLIVGMYFFVFVVF